MKLTNVRTAAALGYQDVVTYTLECESGASLRAAGWRCEGVVRRDGRGWANRPNREDPERKLRWRKEIV